MALSEHERRVCQAIAGRSDAVLADLRWHVAMPTGGRNVAALDETRQAIVRRAESLGAVCELVPGEQRPGWLYGTDGIVDPLPTAVCRRAGKGREVLIAGHLDTVHDPRGAFRELVIAPDGKSAVGPGCVDMKGGLVIAMAALEAIDACGLRPAWTLLLNSDEETGSYHSAAAIMREAERVHAAGGVGIAVEPAAGSDGLVIERAGSGQFMLEARGRAAHVGRDFAAGDSAVRRLCRTVLEVLELSRPGDGLIVNVGPIEGGSATNIVPDRARAWGNVRFSTPEMAEDVERALRDVCLRNSDAGAGTERGSVHAHTSFSRPAKPGTGGTMRFAGLARDVAGDLGQSMTFTKTAGVCDGNLMQATGLPTIDTMGVRGGGLHTEQEWIDLASLVERCQLLAITLLRANAADGLMG